MSLDSELWERRQARHPIVDRPQHVITDRYHPGAPADQLLRRCDEVGTPAIRSPKGLDLDDMIEVVEASLPPKQSSVNIPI